MLLIRELHRFVGENLHDFFIEEDVVPFEGQSVRASDGDDPFQFSTDDSAWFLSDRIELCGELHEPRFGNQRDWLLRRRGAVVVT